GDRRLERVFGAERVQSLGWFRDALERCRAVARIEDQYQEGIGTGFLVEGTDLHAAFPPVVLMTNAHVINTTGGDAACKSVPSTRKPVPIPSWYWSSMRATARQRSSASLNQPRLWTRSAPKTLSRRRSPVISFRARS